jgi:hypothetical protein
VFLVLLGGLFLAHKCIVSNESVALSSTNILKELT